MRWGLGGEGSGGARGTARARGIGVQRHRSRLRSTGWLPFGWGCLYFCPGRGAALVSPQLQEPVNPQQTHVRSTTRNLALLSPQHGL